MMMLIMVDKGVEPILRFWKSRKALRECADERLQIREEETGSNGRRNYIMGYVKDRRRYGVKISISSMILLSLHPSQLIS